MPPRYVSSAGIDTQNTDTVLHDQGFCRERLEDVPEDEQCSECYLKSVQLEIKQPIGGSSVSPDEFDELKKSCNIPTTSYPVDPTSPGTPSAT